VYPNPANNKKSFKQQKKKAPGIHNLAEEIWQIFEKNGNVNVT
jgi:hypothetical protein